ncbi:hypothetical protein ACI2KR_06695 [Pseudomonas luteola]
MKTYILDENNVAIPCEDFFEWAEWFARNGRQVKETQVKGYRISTVFLGLDLNFSGEGDPALFETMVFFEDDYSSPVPFTVANKLPIFDDLLCTSFRCGFFLEAQQHHDKITAEILNRIAENEAYAEGSVSQALEAIRQH